jgi:hypothetical protein
MKTRNNYEPPDFQNLFESCPNQFLVLSTDLKIVAASNAYLKATKTIKSEIVGCYLFDVFPGSRM